VATGKETAFLPAAGTGFCRDWSFFPRKDPKNRKKTENGKGKEEFAPSGEMPLVIVNEMIKKLELGLQSGGFLL
jgi:hypothetical protein